MGKGKDLLFVCPLEILVQSRPMVRLADIGTSSVVLTSTCRSVPYMLSRHVCQMVNGTSSVELPLVLLPLVFFSDSTGTSKHRYISKYRYVYTFAGGC